jgi:hypothetical protein
MHGGEAHRVAHLGGDGGANGTHPLGTEGEGDLQELRGLTHPRLSVELRVLVAHGGDLQQCADRMELRVEQRAPQGGEGQVMGRVGWVVQRRELSADHAS